MIYPLLVEHRELARRGHVAMQLYHRPGHLAENLLIDRNHAQGAMPEQGKIQIIKRRQITIGGKF
jgi:hypothetical protein